MGSTRHRAVTIRPAFPDEEPVLRRLAALDSQRLPDGPLLVAEVEGDCWAAVQVDGPGAVADPFRHTAELLDLLRRRAYQLRGAEDYPSTSRTRRLTAPADSISA